MLVPKFYQYSSLNNVEKMQPTIRPLSVRMDSDESRKRGARNYTHKAWFIFGANIVSTNY